jgi:hypothetical protein
MMMSREIDFAGDLIRLIENASSERWRPRRWAAAPVTRRLRGRRAAATIRVAGCYARAGSGQAVQRPNTRDELAPLQLLQQMRDWSGQ